MKTNFNAIISSKNIQKLFIEYSTIETEHKLKKNLCNCFNISYNDFDKIENIRSLYNDCLLKYYPNEASIKANFINKILFNGKTHVTIFELPVGKSRVDLCKINGTSVAYEIKTDFDTLYRLEKQIYDYSLVFEKVYLICTNSTLSKALKILPDYCGIYIYHVSKSGNISFKKYKKAILSPNINSSAQLNILQKKELLSIYKKTIGSSMQKKELIDVILNNYKSEQINLFFKSLLKNRYHDNWNFIRNNHNDILEIDYQWFFKNCISPDIIYNK